jgi:hypothetical protein
MKLFEADKRIRCLVKKLEELVDGARDFSSSAEGITWWLSRQIPLTPKELYGYGSVFNPLVRLFQDREVNDIDLILVTEQMNRFQYERHMWCSDNKWYRTRPCISCAKDRMLQKLSPNRFINPSRQETPGLKIAIGSLDEDEDIGSGLIRKDQLVLLWRSLPEPSSRRPGVSNDTASDMRRAPSR